MGCGASAQPPPEEELPEDPLERLLKQIHDKQEELTEAARANVEEQAELRYVKTTVVKLEHVKQDMQFDLDNEQCQYDDLKQHIAEQDAYDLREASVGFGTDESKMANIMVARLHENMALTDEIYQRKYNRTLEDQVRGENKSLAGLLTGSLTHFGRFLTYRCMPQPKRDAFLIHKCMSGFGCSDFILMEVLSTRTNDELKAAAEQYAIDQDGEDMVERIKSETGGFGKKWYGLWVDTLVELDRDESGEVPDNVDELAQQLYDAGEGKWMGCDEQPFIDILCKANENTCRAIAEAYDNLDDSKKTLSKAVEDKMGGDLEFAVLARVRSKNEFLAIRLYKACKGWGTDEECIGRVISCMSKKDAQELEEFYNTFFEEEEEPYNNLRGLLASELSGSFLEAIFGVLDSEGPKGHRIPDHIYPDLAEGAAQDLHAEVEGSYNSDDAKAHGKNDLNGPLHVVGVDSLFSRVAPYDYDLDAPEPPFQDKDRSHLFGEDPSDLEGAQKLLDQLTAEVDEVTRQADAANAQSQSMLPGLFQSVRDLRYKDHYLGQILEDNNAMTEFCAARDADYVHEACEGWGTDEDKLIRVLCCLTKKQLNRVNDVYGEKFGKCLQETMDDELGGFFEGSFKYFMKCVITEDSILDASLLRDCMEGWGTNDDLLCEIVCTRTNKELKAAEEPYKILTDGKSVHESVVGDTSGSYKDFLLECLRANRQEGSEIDMGKAGDQAEKLWEAGLSGGDVDANVFKAVLCRASVAQVGAIKDQFEQKYGKTMADAIKETMDGDWERVLLARILDKPTYYAEKLEKAMKGWGTDENALSRILGRNSKAAIRKIAERYEELYGKTLHDAIVSETSGNYQKALLTYLFAEAPGEAADPGAEGDAE